MIRIDRSDGSPLAIVPIFGVHSAILDDDVSVFSTDASGAFDVQEQSVARGAACTLRHEFKEGTRLGFAVRPGSGNEGDHNAYFATIRIKR